MRSPGPRVCCSASSDWRHLFRCSLDWWRAGACPLTRCPITSRFSGEGLSYPAANAGALIVLALAVLGGIVAGVALSAIARELTAARRLAGRLAGLHPVSRDDVFVIDDDRLESFCAGLWRPRVYITSGALTRLDASALGAVLVHERHHARRRDPLRLATSRVIARSLFFVPAARELHRGQQMLAE